MVARFRVLRVLPSCPSVWMFRHIVTDLATLSRKFHQITRVIHFQYDLYGALQACHRHMEIHFPLEQSRILVASRCFIPPHDVRDEGGRGQRFAEEVPAVAVQVESNRWSSFARVLYLVRRTLSRGAGRSSPTISSTPVFRPGGPPQTSVCLPVGTLSIYNFLIIEYFLMKITQIESSQRDLSKSGAKSVKNACGQWDGSLWWYDAGSYYYYCTSQSQSATSRFVKKLTMITPMLLVLNT